jgi:hypothetical protein
LDATQAQVSALAVTTSGDVLAATSNNAAVYRIGFPQGPALFTSQVFDAGRRVRWGGVRALATTGPATVKLETRSGETREPGGAWSAWQPPSDPGSVPRDWHVASPSARYLQYRLRFEPPKGQESGASAGVSSVEVLYRAPNRPPVVAWTLPLGGEALSGKKKISWKGTDPDSDRLEYRVSIEEKGAWKPVELKSSASATLELDTAAYPDGSYRLKVEASDAARNPEEPYTSDAVSDAFTIDNTPPLLLAPVVTKRGNSWEMQIWAHDMLSPLAGAEWRVVEPVSGTSVKQLQTKAGVPVGTPAAPVPAKETKSSEGKDGDDLELALLKSAAKPKLAWQAAAAVDGIFDSPGESIVARIDPALYLAEGSKPVAGSKIELRVRDAAGNSSIATFVLP